MKTNERTDFARTLETRIAELEKERDKAQADAAVMREALEKLSRLYESDYDMDDVGGYRPGWLKAALSTTAGTDLLARHTEALSVAREALEECEDFCDNRSDINEDGRPNFAMKLLDKVRLALRALDAEPVSQPTP